MKFRTHLLLANGLSILFILIILLISYIKMLLSFQVILFLTGVSVAAGLLSCIAHLLLTRPVRNAVQQISQETKRIANGDFEGRVPEMGPSDIRELAVNFNEMTRKLEESFTRLQQSERSRRELVANVSHDLRTPLTSIQSFVEALQDDIIEDEETYRRYLQTIQLETKRLSVLINDLFHLSQLESGVERFSPEPYPLDQLVVETLQNQALLLEKKAMKVDVKIPETILPVSIMPDKIKRVLINLLQNAVKYAPENSLIRLSVKDENERELRVEVSDQGPGLSQAERERVFERFYRVEKSRNPEYGGTGLGLAIARSIIELHGGKIGVESEPGKGSTFWFTLQKAENG